MTVLQEIRIVKELDNEDGETFTCYFDDYVQQGIIPVLDGLALLEAAKIDLMQQHRMLPMPPPEEEQPGA
jgi:hypothetical protein